MDEATVTQEPAPEASAADGSEAPVTTADDAGATSTGSAPEAAPEATDPAVAPSGPVEPQAGAEAAPEPEPAPEGPPPLVLPEGMVLLHVCAACGLNLQPAEGEVLDGKPCPNCEHPLGVG